MKLSPRLQFIYDHLVPGHDVWDICCDHGYVGGAAYKSQKFKNIYFVDPVTNIMQSLEHRFKHYVFDSENKSEAFFLHQKGQEIYFPIYGNVVIAGVGAELIIDIVTTLKRNQLLKAQRLILGPHKDIEMVQQLDGFQHFQVLENGRLRDFFIFDWP